jgi:hypothetical protein
VTSRFRRAAAAIVAATLLTITLVGPVAAQPYRVFVVPLTGAQEVCASPGTPGTCADQNAIGLAILRISPTTDRVCFRVLWAGIDGTVWGGHIHGPALPGTNAGVVVPLFMRDLPGSFGTTSGCLTDADADAIVAFPRQYYVNIHSTVYPDGAIRGQLRF